MRKANANVKKEKVGKRNKSFRSTFYFLTFDRYLGTEKYFRTLSKITVRTLLNGMQLLL